jgi:hypothetical protein
VAAARKGLSQSADSLDSAGRQQIEKALGAVAATLANENPETKVGDLKQLKASAAALDEATKPLADILMDKAMESLLRKRGLIQ